MERPNKENSTQHSTDQQTTNHPIDGFDEIDGDVDDQWRAAAYERYLLRLWQEGKWEPALGPLPVGIDGLVDTDQSLSNNAKDDVNTKKETDA